MVRGTLQHTTWIGQVIGCDSCWAATGQQFALLLLLKPWTLGRCMLPALCELLLMHCLVSTPRATPQHHVCVAVLLLCCLPSRGSTAWPDVWLKQHPAQLRTHTGAWQASPLA